MRALAYCAYQFREVARRVAGNDSAVLTCPPYGEELPPPLRAILGGENHTPPRFLYLDLHMRRAGEGALYGDGGQVALTAAMVRKLDLRGVVVFATTCFLADGGPMLDALLSTGAGVIAGPGKNQGGVHTLLGADLLALWVRRALALGFSPAAALALGKRRLQLQRRKTAAVLDALQFRLFGGYS